MTVIAYRDGVIAADSLMVGGGHIMSRDVTKIYKNGSILHGACGDAAWCKSFHDWMNLGLKGNCPGMRSDESGAIIILPTGLIVDVNVAGFIIRSDLDFWAIGCGADYAIGAMECGASAEEACKVAITWNSECGGDIKVLRRKTP